MLWEAWQYFTTPASPLAKKMGFLEEAIAMAARQKRCQPQWQLHYQACQQAILKAVESCHQTRKIVILGAGSLLDIPLKVLATRFDQVILVDLVFLKAARKQAARYPNVILLEMDLTASLQSAFLGENKIENHQAWWFLAQKKPEKFTERNAENQSIDCLVSLNLLTQLPLIPVRWLMQKYDLTESEADSYAKGMIQAHLDELNRFDCVHCLIADRQVIEQDGSGQVTERFDPAWEVELPSAEFSWDWQMIPLGEVSKDYCQIHRVGVSIW